MALPQHMRADDPTAADPARHRLLRKSPFPRLPSLPSRTSTHPPLPSPHSADPILIDDPPMTPPPNDDDLYRWAVLYENQRGITLFSTPFYSSLSLLPSDPPPFTTLHTRNTRAYNSTLSLDNYPLPDGTWCWVSSAWMIDMRTHLGEVQHDGFEYNWSFRHRHWHAQIGKLSAGAWVRRRRWIRLMVRPANLHACSSDIAPNGNSVASVVLHELDLNLSHTWVGGEQDWLHVHRLLKQLGRDGRRLELWRAWLGFYVRDPTFDVKGKHRQLDASPPPLHELRSSNVAAIQAPPLVHLTAILARYGEAILHSFVFPDSRAQFVRLVRQAGLAQVLAHCLGHDFSAADADFWSYADAQESD